MEKILRLNIDSAKWGLTLQRKDGQPDTRFDKPPEGFSLAFINTFIPNPQELAWNERPSADLRAGCAACHGDYVLTVVFPANSCFFTAQGVVEEFLEILGRPNAVVKDAHDETIGFNQTGYYS